MAKTTLRSEWVRCGKNCSRCPHGPYWYAYWRVNGKLHKRYLGKGRPEDGWNPELATPSPFDAIFSSREATPELAFRILGMQPTTCFSDVRHQYRSMMPHHHPDMGGDERVAKWINCAFSYLKTYFGV